MRKNKIICTLGPSVDKTETRPQRFLQMKGDAIAKRSRWLSISIALRPDCSLIRFLVQLFNFLRSGVVIPGVEKQYVAVPDGI